MIDRETCDVSYEVEANLPGSGWTKLGKAQGNLKQGPVELQFSVSLFVLAKLWGEITLQLEGGTRPAAGRPDWARGFVHALSD
jgi:hypothetical protein